MVVVRVHRRAASVPVGEPNVGEDTNLAAKNSYLFSRAAIDTADALSSASKKNDEQFLRDINNRIGSAPFAQPYVKTIRRTQVHTPASPSVTRRRSIAVSSVLRPPVPTDTTDDDVDYEVKLIAPLTNRLTKHGRATSVPPLTGSVLAPVVGRSAVIYGAPHSEYDLPRSHVVLGGDEAEFYHRAPVIYDLEVPKTATNQNFNKLNPLADLAVRQAHRNLDRIEREIQSSGDVIISRPASPRSTLYTASRDGPWRRSLSYHGPRSSTVRTRSPSPVSRAPGAPARRHVRSTITKTGAPVVTDDEIFDYLAPGKVKTDLLLAGTDPSVYSSYRLKTNHPLPSTAKRTSSLTDALLYDLHLNSPDSLGISTSSNTVKKVTTPLILAVTTAATPYTHSLYAPSVPLSVITHTLPKPPVVPKRVAPISPRPPPQVTSSIPSGLPPVIRPKVSETRRKVRDVLCKVKGDPHYFDD